MAGVRPVSLFRLRYALHTLIYGVGLFAPWDRLVAGSSRLSTCLVLAADLGRQGWMSFTAATMAVLICAIFLAFAAAALRTWATAWMGYGVVGSGEMQAATLVAEGPYRRMRHPLYVGIFLHTLALAVLMLPAGAMFALVSVVLLDGWFAVAEDRFLGGRLGAAYEAYRKEVPAVVPTRRPRSSAGGGQAMWGLAAASEIYFWGVAISFVVLGWRYNVFLMHRGVLVSFGLALVVRALLPKQAPAA